MHPPVPCMRQFGDGVQPVDRSGVDVPHLTADDQGPGCVLESRFQCRNRHPALIVYIHGVNLPGHAEKPKRPIDGRVATPADQHPGHRSTEQTVALHIPSGPGQHGVAGGGQAAEVGHRATGGDTGRCALR